MILWIAASACVYCVEIQLETETLTRGTDSGTGPGPVPSQEEGPAGGLHGPGAPGWFLDETPVFLLPRPAQPTGGKKRKRASDDITDCKVLKPLLSGSIPVDQFVQMLEKVSAVGVGVPRMYPLTALASLPGPCAVPAAPARPRSGRRPRQAGAAELRGALRPPLPALPLPPPLPGCHKAAPQTHFLWEPDRGRAFLQKHSCDAGGCPGKKGLPP